MGCLASGKSLIFAGLSSFICEWDDNKSTSLNGLLKEFNERCIREGFITLNYFTHGSFANLKLLRNICFCCCCKGTYYIAYEVNIIIEDTKIFELGYLGLNPIFTKVNVTWLVQLLADL